jgi:hypothetical protein
MEKMYALLDTPLYWLYVLFVAFVKTASKVFQYFVASFGTSLAMALVYYWVNHHELPKEPYAFIQILTPGVLVFLLFSLSLYLLATCFIYLLVQFAN